MKNLIKCFQISCVFFLAGVGMIQGMEVVDGKHPATAVRKNSTTDESSSRSNSPRTSAVGASAEPCTLQNVLNIVERINPKICKINLTINITNAACEKNDHLAAIENLQKQVGFISVKIVNIEECFDPSKANVESLEKSIDEKNETTHSEEMMNLIAKVCNTKERTPNLQKVYKQKNTNSKWRLV